MWINDFIERTGNGTLMPAHFLSTHSYPTDYRTQTLRTVWEDGIIAVSQQAAAAGFPLVMTEVSAGLGSQYDPPFGASFIAHAAAAFLGVTNIPTLSYWTFSDIFEEPGFQSQTWINTYGIQTKYGVPKPVYRSFEMLAKLPKTGMYVNADSNGEPRRLGLSAAGNCTATIGTVDVVTAIDTSLGTTAILYAYVTNWNVNVNDATNPTTGLPITTQSGIVINFSGLPSNAVPASQGTFSLIDSTHAFARPIFEKNGQPLYPTQAQIDEEMQASLVIPSPIQVVNQDASTISIVLPDLEPYATALVVIEVMLT